MYNYFVRGEAGSYGFADAYYVDFLRSSDPDAVWADRLGRVEYLVVNDRGESPSRSKTTYQQLQERFEDGGGRTAGLARYRVRYLASGRDLAVFSIVPGATIQFDNSSSPSTVTTNVTVSGESIHYVRRVSSEGEGPPTVTVAHPGTYVTEGGHTITVDEASVRSGRLIEP
jgi:hypothetical protein